MMETMAVSMKAIQDVLIPDGHTVAWAHVDVLEEHRDNGETYVEFLGNIRLESTSEIQQRFGVRIPLDIATNGDIAAVTEFLRDQNKIMLSDSDSESVEDSRILH